MNNDFILWKLAQQRQAELLKEAENERLLRQAGLVKPSPLAVRLLVIAGLCLPWAVLFLRIAFAVASGGRSQI